MTRHAFFATNHGCAFNRLQYSAAFIATMEFHFAMSGTQLFLNTFGWEIVGLMLTRLASSAHRKPTIWRWHFFYQLLETFLSCISVSILRRHLMVWAVYAPRFLFAAIFLVLHGTAQVAEFILAKQ
jgi:GPI ethanolamine phosphate transferase 3 subunit O